MQAKCVEGYNNAPTTDTIRKVVELTVLGTIRYIDSDDDWVLVAHSRLIIHLPFQRNGDNVVLRNSGNSVVKPPELYSEVEVRWNDVRVNGKELTATSTSIQRLT